MSCDRSELDKRFGIKDRVTFFEECQEGGRNSAIEFSGTLIWENGSNRELCEGGAGCLMDATWYDAGDAMQVKELLWYRIRYVQARLEQAIERFETAKKQLTDKAHYASIHGSPSPTPEQLKYVRRLRHEVIKFNRKENELMELANPAPEPFVYTEEQIKTRELNMKEADKILNSLNALEI